MLKSKFFISGRGRHIKPVELAARMPLTLSEAIFLSKLQIGKGTGTPYVPSVVAVRVIRTGGSQTQPTMYTLRINLHSLIIS